MCDINFELKSLKPFHEWTTWSVNCNAASWTVVLQHTGAKYANIDYFRIKSGTIKWVNRFSWENFQHVQYKRIFSTGPE
jgi:hypothetical protein